MTLQASGAISFANIQTEFGGANPIGFNEYYRSGSYVNAQLTYAINAINWDSNNVVLRYDYDSTYRFFWGGTQVLTATGSNTSGGLDHRAGTASGHTIYVYGCGSRVTNASNYQRWIIWRKNKAAYSGIPTSGTISMNQFYNASNTA